MAEWRTLKGKVKSVNQKNSGFTLVDDPDTWLNYSKQGDGAKVQHEAQRGDVVEVQVNDNNWIQTLRVIDSAGRQASSPGVGRPGGVPGTWSPAPRDPRDSLHIGRQSALKSAVEFMGYLPTIEPTQEAIAARVKLLIDEVATPFSRFVNLPLGYTVDEKGNVRVPGAGDPRHTTSSGSEGAQAASASPQSQNGAAGPAPAPASPAKAPVYCQRDGQPIKGVKFQDGTTWPAERLVEEGKALCGEALCNRHFFEERDNPEKQAARAAAVAASVGVTKGAEGLHGVVNVGLDTAPETVQA